MNKQRAYENVRILGHKFALAMDNIGKGIEEKSALADGVAAYKILNLQGEFDWLDASIEIVMRDVLALARDGLNGR